MVPILTAADVKTLYQNVQEMLKDPIEKTIPPTFQELYEREYPNYKNAIFHYLG